MQSQYAYPAGAYFCSCKSRQNTLGAVPQDPLTLKLRLDTNDAKASSVQRRRYALKVPAAHFYVEIVDRVPLPRCGGGVGGAEPSAARGGCSEAEHPQRSKKSSKRAARRFFRAPQGGGGKYAVATFGAHLCAVRICFSRLLREKQYSYPAQLSVKGVCQGGIRPP